MNNKKLTICDRNTKTIASYRFILVLTFVVFVSILLTVTSLLNAMWQRLSVCISVNSLSHNVERYDARIQQAFSAEWSNSLLFVFSCWTFPAMNSANTSNRSSLPCNLCNISAGKQSGTACAQMFCMQPRHCHCRLGCRIILSLLIANFVVVI